MNSSRSATIQTTKCLGHLVATAWLCAWVSQAHALAVSEDVLSWVEARTIQNTPSSPLEVRVEGDISTQQVLQLEQNGLVIYEQQLRNGQFRISNLPPLRKDSPLTVRLKSPDQADEQTELPLKPNQRREIFVKRPELLALAPTAIPKPLSDKVPRSQLEEDIEFDLDFLRGKAFRNLSPLEVKRLGSVRPGNIDTDIYRNGNLVTKGTVLFALPPDGDVARACISPALFQQLGVKTAFISQRGLQLMKTKAEADAPNCLFIEQWVEGASSEFDNSDLRLELTIAQAFLTKQVRQSVPPEMLTTGENAGFINYSLNNYNTKDVNSNFLGLNTGINIASWQVRHTSYLSHSRGGNTSSSQYINGETIIKKPLVELKSSLAIGYVSSQSPIIGSTPLRGVRLGSEEGLLPDEEKSYRPIIRGVARTNARVRISQNKVVFFEQTVPPGPFEFEDINPISAVGELQVVIAEADGSQQTFVVPYSQVGGKLNPGSYRYNIAAGLYSNPSSAQQRTGVVQAYVRYGLNSYFTPGVEILLAPNYCNIGMQAGFNTEMGSLSFNSLFSRFTSTDGVTANGLSQNITYGAPTLGRFNVFAGTALQSPKYTTPSTGLSGGAATLFTNDSFRINKFAGVSVNMSGWGSLNVSASQQRTWQDAGGQQLRLGYANSVGSVFYGINFDHATTTSQTAAVDSISLTASIPLSLASVQGGLRAGYNQTGHDQQGSSSVGFYGHHAPYQLSYNLTHAQAGSNNSTSSASANWQHPYGGLGASLSSSTGGSQQYGLNANGGLVLHRGGVILAPTLGDTFAIVEIPNGKGAGVLGSQVRVNSSGYGVVPYLSPYYQNDVQISLEGASMDLEIENINQKVAPVDGSIVRLKFNSTSGRPLLIIFQPGKDRRIPIGASISDSSGKDMGTVGQGNRGLIRVEKLKDRLKVVWGEKPEESCMASYALDEKTLANASGFINLKLPCEVGLDDSTALIDSRTGGVPK